MKQTWNNQRVHEIGQPWSREGVNAPITRAATFVIATADAAPASKHQADYICTGIHDQEEIAIAINTLPSIGGSIQLTEGAFNFSAKLNLPPIYDPAVVTRGFAVRGAGYGTYINYNGADPVIGLGNTRGVLIESLRTDAGGIDPGFGTETVLRYWKDNKWVEYYDRPSGLQVSSVLLVMSAPSQNFVELPKLSIATRVEVLVLTAFNSDGTNTISVGKSVDLDMLALAVDVSTTGPKIVLAGAYLGTILSVAGGFPPVATYVAGGSAPTTGMAIVSIYWHRAPL
jgi:hypothetical protein